MSTYTDAHGGSQQHHLPTTTTFLPILDDLLSPDFRPVSYPPVITPLQTPTTAVLPASSASGGVATGVKNEEAAVKIQIWWRKSKSAVLCRSGDGREERVKHSVRHRRAEEHIRALESEVLRLKQSLATERKLRSLQYEAIRSLWSQVQKLTVNNPSVDLQSNTIMSQSLPNGLPVTTLPTQNGATQHTCNCASTMTTAVQKLEDEISELRNLIMQSVVKEEGGSAMDSSTSSGSTKANKRPDSLDLNGGAKTGVNAKPEELQGYANEMAKFVVERGINDNLEGGGVQEAGK